MTRRRVYQRGTGISDGPDGHRADDVGFITAIKTRVLTFVSSVVVIIGLNQLFYRTSLGRAFRATSDDRVTAGLMGVRPDRIFATATDKLLGFLRVDIDAKLGRYLVSMLIGEPEYRHKGVTNAITVPFRDYFFETLGLNVMLATALSHNKPIISYLYATGWTLDRTVPKAVKSNTGEGAFDLCYFSQTAEGWRAWKKAKGT